MGDVLSPFTVAPPPPPSSPNSSMPMLYYGLAVVGTAVIVLAMYNFIIIKRCSRRHVQSQPAGPNRLVEVVRSSRSFDNSNRNLLLSFKYKKEAGGGGVIQGEEKQDEDYECPVCLSVFEEEEEVSKLPRCKHSFHAACIDMWLYSHLDCPICRTPVGHFCERLPGQSNTPIDNSREGLLESGISI